MSQRLGLQAGDLHLERDVRVIRLDAQSARDLVAESTFRPTIAPSLSIYCDGGIVALIDIVSVPGVQRQIARALHPARRRGHVPALGRRGSPAITTTPRPSPDGDHTFWSVSVASSIGPGAVRRP